MGIKNFFPLIGNGIPITLDYLKNRTIGLDMSFVLYMLSLSMKNTNSLSDKNGTSTVMLFQLLNYLINLKKRNINIVVIYDNPSCNTLKINEIKKRCESKQKIIEKKITSNKPIDKVSFKITKEIIEESIFILENLGIEYCVSPKDIEAEKLGAYLLEIKKIDYLITNDSDSLTFGSSNIIRQQKINNKKTYSLYNLDQILKNLNITYFDFVKISVILGSDFCEKTKGIGIKTVLKKYNNIELTEEQKLAYNYFISKVSFDLEDIVKPNKNIPAIIEYIRSKNFDINLWSNKLGVFN